MRSTTLRCGLFVWLLATGTIAVVSVTDWLDPNWRFELSNALLAWCTIGVTGGVLASGWWGIRQTSHMSFLVAVATYACVGAVVFAIIGGVVWLATHRESGAAANTSAASTSEADANPILQLAFESEQTLPIIIDPNRVVYIVRIRQGETVEPLWFKNTENSIYKWPTSEDIWPRESVGLLTISNQGKLSVFDASVDLRIEFGALNEGRGMRQVAVSLPPAKILIGQTAQFWFVNQSNSGAMVRFPESAMMQVQGETNRRLVSLHARDLSILDQVTFVSPSRHKWDHDMIIDPDQEKIRKPSKTPPPANP
jgi:hypothetical protein